MKFDGEKFADQIKKQVKAQIKELVRQRGIRPKIVSFVFLEDKTGQLYTRLKKAVAQDVGIDYRPHLVRFSDYDLIVDEIKKLNQDQSVTGIMIQKPTRKVWELGVYSSELEVSESDTQMRSTNESVRLQSLKPDREFAQQMSVRRTARQNSFVRWWQGLVSCIEPKKDVDGLNPVTLEAIKDDTWQEKGLVPPATAKAVLNIITHFIPDWSEKKIAIIGPSYLVGRPLYFMLKHALLEETWVTSISCRLDEEDKQVVLMGRKEFQALVDSGKGLKEFDIIVSATGRPDLINASMVKEGVALIDVGEPKGDINPNAYKKASFYTPVPGGVGPVTVVSLMENGVQLIVKS